MRRTAALIVGGGPAGSAAAITLARGGVQPELVERTAGEHDVVCGGFLGWDALAALERLGLNASSLGARPIQQLRLVSRDRSVEVDLPRRAAGLSRRRLDAALLEYAAGAGASIVRGCSVRGIDLRTTTVRLDEGLELAADALLLATGKHNLRGAARQWDRGSQQLAVGMRAALAPSAQLASALNGIIELHLFDDGYAGILLQEDLSANLCISVSEKLLRRAGSLSCLVGTLAERSPTFGERLGDVSHLNWTTIARVPYGWRAGDTCRGVFRVGDQCAVIASLAGDGVAIALRSGAAAADALLGFGPQGASDYQRAFASRSARPLAVAGLLKHAVETSWSRTAILQLTGLLPGLAGIAARLTRIG